MSKIIIFDTETTGLNEEDRIIQIGAIVIDIETNTLYEKGVYNEFCSSDIPIKLKAMATHGTRQEDIFGKPTFKELEFYKVLDELNSEENYLVAHNLPFDLKMLEKEGFVNKFKLIDTLQSSKHSFEVSCDENETLDRENRKVPDYQLQSFRYKLFSKKDEQIEIDKYNGIEIKSHDAIGDVIILKLFLYKLYQFSQKKNPSIKFKKFLDLLSKFSDIDVELKTMTFGKYKCKSFEEILIEDKGYLEWLLKQQKEDGDRNFVYTLKKILK